MTYVHNYVYHHIWKYMTNYLVFCVGWLDVVRTLSLGDQWVELLLLSFSQYSIPIWWAKPPLPSLLSLPLSLFPLPVTYAYMYTSKAFICVCVYTVNVCMYVRMYVCRCGCWGGSCFLWDTQRMYGHHDIIECHFFYLISFFVHWLTLCPQHVHGVIGLLPSCHIVFLWLVTSGFQNALSDIDETVVSRRVLIDCSTDMRLLLLSLANTFYKQLFGSTALSFFSSSMELPIPMLKFQQWSPPPFSYVLFVWGSFSLLWCGVRCGAGLDGHSFSSATGWRAI